MHCRTALEYLECVSPPAAAGDAPRAVDAAEPSEMSAARAHLEECPRCRNAFAAIQKRDREIAAAMRDVFVPDDLRDRLFASLSIAPPASASDDVPEAVVEPTLPGESTSRPAVAAIATPRRRRSIRGWAAAVATAIALCVAVGLWWGNRGPETFATADWHDEAEWTVADIGRLDRFDENFAAFPPAGWSGRIEFTDPYGIEHPTGSARSGRPHLAAIYAFRLGSGASMVSGVVIAIPKSRIADPPTVTRFDPHGGLYPSAGGVTVVAWTEGDLVYVCGVRGGAAQPERLDRALRFDPV
ncbi:MAG: hypothetical protein WD066_06745 [Planctomycetaceae bacterium]